MSSFYTNVKKYVKNFMGVSTVLISLFQKAEEAFDLVWKLMNYWTEKKQEKKIILIFTLQTEEFPIKKNRYMW